MSKVELQNKLIMLSEHYDLLAEQHGYSHHAVQQSSQDTHEKRFEILLEGFTDFADKKILDFGCGAAHFLDFLKKRNYKGEYVGYDISENLLDIARKRHPEARFENKNIFSSPPTEYFDLIFISGVFNNDISVNDDFFKDTLKILFPHCRDGLGFNCLSTYVDFKADGLFYFDPSYVFSFCKSHLTSKVTLRHDYEVKTGVVPFEFSCYLRSSSHYPRVNNHA